MTSLEDLRSRAERRDCPRCEAGAVAPHHPDKIACRQCGWVEGVIDLDPHRSLREF